MTGTYRPETQRAVLDHRRVRHAGSVLRVDQLVGEPGVGSKAEQKNESQQGGQNTREGYRPFQTRVLIRAVDHRRHSVPSHRR